MGARVSGLATTAVKSLRLATVQRVGLDEFGARGNRAFCVIDDRGRLVNAKRFALLQAVRSSHDHGELELTFPNGSRAAGPVRYSETLPIKFFSNQCDARVLAGPWSRALSEYVGAPLRIVEPEVGVDRGRSGGVSVISRASVEHLAEVAGEESIDVRRFRMLIRSRASPPTRRTRGLDAGSGSGVLWSRSTATSDAA